MVKNIYSIFRFLFEILSVMIVGYWGFGLSKLNNFRYVFGILAPLCIIIIWGIWGAPASVHRLDGVARLLLELGVYAISAICLLYTNSGKHTYPYAVTAILNAGINYFTN